MHHHLHPKNVENSAEILSLAALSTTFRQVEIKVFEGIKNKQVWQLHPTEPYTKHLSANERSHGNDDGAGLAKFLANAPLCPYSVSESPQLCGVFADPQEIELEVIATGDYYYRQWCLDLQHYTFVSESRFYLCWWLPGRLLTVTSG